MIVFQSSWSALCRRPYSPEGCGRLAGDDIPGKRSHYPRALKGRGKEFIFSMASSPLHLPALDFRMPDSSSALMDGPLTLNRQINLKANQKPADAGQKNFTSLLALNPPSCSSLTFYPFKPSALNAMRGPANLCQPLPRNANLCHALGGLYLMKRSFLNIHAANHKKVARICICI
jgi:hypothetical protein